jgi:hypothetical protein
MIILSPVVCSEPDRQAVSELKFGPMLNSHFLVSEFPDKTQFVLTHMRSTPVELGMYSGMHLHFETPESVFGPDSIFATQSDGKSKLLDCSDTVTRLTREAESKNFDGTGAMHAALEMADHIGIAVIIARLQNVHVACLQGLDMNVDKWPIHLASCVKAPAKSKPKMTENRSIMRAYAGKKRRKARYRTLETTKRCRLTES